MSLLIDARGLHDRRAVAAGALGPLSGALRAQLQPLIEASPAVPVAKALLSRAGGRCATDGTVLHYEPFDARHCCPRCGAEYAGEVHDRFRLYWHQMWLAERVLHAALLGVLLDDAPARVLSMALLDAYADQYLLYPNADNVLGPSRPFFSTYLESIWLLQLSLAIDLLETGAASREVAAVGDRVRDRVLEPSVSLIASYDEGLSNRQVWNNAALMAAGSLLGHEAMVERAFSGPSGTQAHLTHGLLADGSWYEGENYHFFAHRGLWYCATLAAATGRELPGMLGSRFDEGFAAPFRTLLPDLTFPSRRDSPYAVSVRQPRFAEACELGLARRDDDRLLAMLARLYDPDVPATAAPSAATTADVERNAPGSAISRADLGWRSLLFARAALPPLRATPFVSDLLPSQGIGILRREAGALYVALDYGHSGGGHGHPDRLNLLLSQGSHRWLDDPGTGSYVDPSLHWYRSTLAHTAPLVDGRSQPRTTGELIAHEDIGEAAWLAARARLAPGLEVRRTVVLMPDYLMDELAWSGDAVHEIALALHGARAVDEHDADRPSEPCGIDNIGGVEDGFAFLRDARGVSSPAGESLCLLRTDQDGTHLRGWSLCRPGTTWWSALAPGPPADPPLRPMLLQRHSARAGSFVTVWSLTGEVAEASDAGGALRVRLRSGAVHVHRRAGDEWRVQQFDRAGACREIALRGAEAAAATVQSIAPSDQRTARVARPAALPLRVNLAEAHYRRSELTWHEAGEPAAAVQCWREAPATLVVDIAVAASSPQFVAPEAVNRLDNEPAGIHGDGVQLYVRAGQVGGGWLLVPVHGGSAVSQRGIDGWNGGLAVSASWTTSEGGYALRARVALPPGTATAGVDVLVNDVAPGRERRRGQLVMSGARGEFVYLRGDRHDPERLVRISLADD